MQAKIAELEQALAAALPPAIAPTPPSGGMGYNNPPEGMKIQRSDIDEIKGAVRAPKAQPPSSPDKWAEALQAIERLETKTSKLRERIERREEEFFSEATKAAGKQAGTWLAGTFVIWLVGQMLVFRSLLTRGWRLCRNSR